MSQIPWIDYRDRMVGQSSPSYDDTLNVALKAVVTESGLDPAADFPGFATIPGLADEATARIAGDAATLASAATDATTKADAAEANAESYADGIVADEATTRAAADAALQTNIDNEATARIAGDAATLATAETDATTKANAAQAAAIAAAAADATTKADAAQATAESYADGIVATEATARATADTILTNNLNQEISDRIADIASALAYTDTQVGAETTARIAAVSSEATTRASADTTLQGNLTSEETTRATADTTLQTHIDSEAATRGAADDALQAGIDDVQTNLDAETAARIAADDTLTTGLSDEISDRIAAVASAITTAESYTDDARPQDARVEATLKAYLANNAVFNLLDYGAVLDGSTDDTVAVRAAIAAAYAAGGGVVTAPVSRCAISDWIEIPETVRFLPQGQPTYRTAVNGFVFVALSGFAAHLDGNGVSRQIMVRMAGSTATPTPLYALGTSSMGGTIANVTCDMTTLGANARAFSWEGVWLSTLINCKATGYTDDTQVGLFIGFASIALGGTYWNRIDGYLSFGSVATPHGIAMQVQGGSGTVYPTQHHYRNLRAEYNYRGLVMDTCGAGHTFTASAWEVCTDNGVTITNQKVTGAPVFIGCESSTNGGWGYSGTCLCIETTAQNNTAGAYDASVFRLRADTSGGYYSSTMPYQSAYFVGAETTLSAAAGDTLTPGALILNVNSTGGQVALNATTQISNGKAGQILVLRGRSSTDYVQLINGGNVRIRSSTFNLTLDSILTLIWSPGASDWVEVTRTGGSGSGTSTAAVSYAAGGQMSPVASLMSVTSTGGASVLLDGTAQIVDASPGQTITLRGGSNSNYIRLINGANVRLRTPYIDLTLDRCLTLVWSTTAGDWVEVCRTVGSAETLSLASGATIKPANELANVSSTGGAVLLDGTTQIENGTEDQVLVLRGGSNANYVTFINGANVRLATPTFDLTLDAVLTLRWSPVAVDWVEVSRRVATAESVQNKSTNYTAFTQDDTALLRFDVTAVGKTLTVTSALPVGWSVIVGKVDSSGNTLTVSGSGCTFNSKAGWGASSLTTTTQGHFWRIVHIGSGVYDVVGTT